MADLYKCLFSKYFILPPVWFNAGFLYMTMLLFILFQTILVRQKLSMLALNTFIVRNCKNHDIKKPTILLNSKSFHVSL